MLFSMSCSDTGKSNKGAAQENQMIYFKYDSSNKPMYYISEKLVPDSIWREKLGKALVTIYLGKEWWREDKNTFKEADDIGIKVLLEASKAIENDAGTAAFVLRQMGPAGCEAMLKSLKETIAKKGGPDIYFIGELGDSGYQNAKGVLSEILNNADYFPDVRIAATKALAKLGDYSGLNVLKKMRDDERYGDLRELLDKEIREIEKTGKNKK